MTLARTTNPAAPVDAPTRVCLRSLRSGRRATEQRCWRAMKRLVLVFCFLGAAVSVIAQDRLVLERVAGGWSMSTNSVPGPVLVTGAVFSGLRKDVQGAVEQLGDKADWWDVGPDASYASLEIYLGAKRYVINSWYPLFRTNQTVAVSEKNGLVVVSGLDEKKKVEEKNSARYRSIVGLFDKVEKALQPEGAANGSQPIRSGTNRTSSAAGSRR